MMLCSFHQSKRRHGSKTDNVCVCACACVCARACPSSLCNSPPPLLQSSTRRSAKVSSSTADRGGQTTSKQNDLKQQFILKSFKGTASHVSNLFKGHAFLCSTIRTYHSNCRRDHNQDYISVISVMLRFIIIVLSITDSSASSCIVLIVFW